MSLVYTRKAWDRVGESEVLTCIEEVYSRKGYLTKNFHREDRRHEKGIDLFCKKGDEQIAFAVKKKPGEEDIKQLRMFIDNTKNMRSIYVYVYPPTRPFEEVLNQVRDQLEIWHSAKLHDELLYNESVFYLCLYFSAHPIVESLTDACKIIYENRGSKYVPHKPDAEEVSILWLLKDNVVKMRSTLLQIHKRWAKSLMAKTQKLPDEFQGILNSVFSDLDIANEIAGDKMVSSFSELSSRYPSLLGLYWELARHRTEWDVFTHTLEKLPKDEVERYIVFKWVLPGLTSGTGGVMRGFYSSVSYILENLHRTAENLEDGIDWVFQDMRIGTH